MLFPFLFWYLLLNTFFLKETAERLRIEIAKAVDLPHISIEIPAFSSLQPFGSAPPVPPPPSRSKPPVHRKDGSHIMETILAYSEAKVFTPFSGKRVLRQSDTPHKKAPPASPSSSAGITSPTPSDSDADTLLPGDKAEMKQFCDTATRASRIQIKVSIPVVSLQIRTKQLLEVLYNRINSDLLLWEPMNPIDEPSQYEASSVNPLLSADMMDSMYTPYSMAKSGIYYDSNSDSEADASEQMFYSMYDRSPKKPQTSSEIDRTCAMAFKLSIGQGTMTMFSPVRDNQKHVIPGQLGEFILKLGSTELFSVSGYNGDADLGYVCMQAGAIEIYHCGLTPVPSAPPLRLIGSVLPAHILSTIYPTPRNITLMPLPEKPSKRDMMSLAIEVQKKTDQRVKKIKLAIGLEHTTMRHHSTLKEHNWLIQLIDLFDLKVRTYTDIDIIEQADICVFDFRTLLLKATTRWTWSQRYIYICGIVS